MRKRQQRINQEFLTAVGEAVRQRRIDALLSQEELGMRCGVHRTYITEIENGMRNISLLTVCKVAQALNVEAWELLRVETNGNGDNND